MTESKSIIIDGVDVSECKYYDDLDCYAERDNCGYPLDCKDSPNCYFKQLKRKEQILAEIKEMCSEMDCESLMQNSWCGNTDFKMGCCEKFFKKQILQKTRESEIKYES